MEEAEPQNSHTSSSPPGEDSQPSPPKERSNDGHSESDEPNGDAGPTESLPKRPGIESEPRKIGSRRSRSASKRRPKPEQPPASRPELVCRRVSAARAWEVILCADDECQLTVVHLEGTPVDFTGRQCRVPSLRGRLTVSSQDRQEHAIPLFEDDPLIFKLRKKWAGEGHRISRITTGHFIVIAPDTWVRTGRAPVEPAGCSDPAFRAHYFHWDETESDRGVDGFREWSGSLVATGIELTGRHIYDDSDDGNAVRRRRSDIGNFSGD